MRHGTHRLVRAGKLVPGKRGLHDNGESAQVDLCGASATHAFRALTDDRAGGLMLAIFTPALSAPLKPVDIAGIDVF